MAKNKIFSNDSSGAVEFNMTPMIDCTFLLIIFFILTATVMNDALADLELHRPFESKANSEELNELPNCTIVNVISEAKDENDIDSLESSRAKEYIIIGESFEIGDREALVNRIRRDVIAAKEEGHRDYYVEIRADHRVNFGAVQGVLKAAAAAGVRGIEMKMNITALTPLNNK
ncbi:MAG: biopolymer transporter ExbD [bacterium]|nr:biopolymer transporter ExbD [bacterium]